VQPIKLEWGRLNMARRARAAGSDPERHGIGEWFGNLVANITPERRAELAAKSRLPVKTAAMPCPFRQEADPEAICNKKGGVCTLRPHRRAADGTVSVGGPLVTLCPSRFWQDNSIFRWIGQTILDTSEPTLIKEVEFLESVLGATDADEVEEGETSGKGDAVGRIDTVLMHPNNPREWCALELQAVYFSGEGMPSHLAQYNDPGPVVFPDANRRPDFRSSGPKRLMPQLQTKVPTLRRWGRKMAVVVDKPFFASLGPMTRIPHLSNADIAWFVVDYDHDTGAIRIAEQVYTTLESSVEALTAGIPRSREAFESKLGEILDSKARNMVKKVIRLSKSEAHDAPHDGSISLGSD
jgi:hypothetical protein